MGHVVLEKKDDGSNRYMLSSYQLVELNDEIKDDASVADELKIYRELADKEYFNNFGLIYFLTQGGPVNPDYLYAGHTDILISWIYKLTMNDKMYNMASVLSILIFLVLGSMSAINFMRTAAFKEE